MADKILYANKEKLLDDITIPNKNKVTADDMNEIKEVVNAHADDIDELDEVKANRTEIPTDLSELSNETTKFVNETQLSEAIESEESAREEADENIQGQIDSINDDISALDDRVEANEDDIADINLEQTIQDNEIGALKLDSGHTIELSINTTNYELSAKLKNKSGTILNTSTIDLPLETMIINVEYDNANKQLIITLQNGNKIYVPIADIIGGLQSEITPENMLSSDLVDDNNHSHKFMSISEKTKLEGIETGAEVNVIEVIKVDGTAITVTNKTINIDLSAKEDKSNKVTSLSSSSTDTQYPSAKCVYDSQAEQDNEISALRNLAETELEDATATGTSITVNDSANAPAKLLPSGNTYQATNIKTYECEGTETGDYYFIYDSINYQFTMPTISANSVLAFNTDTLKLYLGDTEISTTTDNTGTLITMADTPNPSYPQTIHNVRGHNQIRIIDNLFNANELTYDNNYYSDNGVLQASIITGHSTNYINVKENTSYTINGNADVYSNSHATKVVGRIYFWDNNKNWIQRSSQITSNSYTFRTPINAKFITLQVFVGEITVNQINNINKIKELLEIIKSNQEQNLTFTLPEGMEMCKIGNYADEFVKQDGKWYKNKKIDKIVLDGSEDENYTKSSTYSNTDFSVFVTNTFNIQLGQNYRGSIIANYFILDNTIGRTSPTIKTGFSYTGSNFGLRISIESSLADDVTSFKIWLSTHNVIMYFPATTPVLEEITDTTLIQQLDAMQKIISYYQQTNVNTISAGDLEAILTLGYKKSNRLRIDALEQAIISLGGNI